MQAHVKDLINLLKELEKTSIHILSVDGTKDDPKDFYIGEYLINGRTHNEYESYLKQLCENVISSKILRTSTKRKDVKELLNRIRFDFTIIPNSAYHNIWLPSPNSTTRKSLDISFASGLEWISEYNSSRYFLDRLNSALDLLFETLISIVDDLMWEIELKKIVDNTHIEHSYEYLEWNTNDQPLRDLLDILKKEKKIADILWKDFSKAFNGKSKAPIDPKIEWLVSVSEFKMLIDTLFSTGKFKPKQRKWEIASRCFVLRERPNIDWTKLKGQKPLAYQLAYLSDIKILFG